MRASWTMDDWRTEVERLEDEVERLRKQHKQEQDHRIATEDEVEQLRAEKQGWVNQAAVEEKERKEAEAENERLRAELERYRRGSDYYHKEWGNG